MSQPVNSVSWVICYFLKNIYMYMQLKIKRFVRDTYLVNKGKLN